MDDSTMAHQKATAIQKFIIGNRLIPTDFLKCVGTFYVKPDSKLPTARDNSVAKTNKSNCIFPK